MSPEHPTPLQHLTALKKLQADFNAAYDRKDIPKAEMLKSAIEAEAATLRNSLDPTAQAEGILGPDMITLKEIADIADAGGIKVFDVKSPLRSHLTREDLTQAKEHGEQLYYLPDTFTPEIVAKHSFPNNSITMQRLYTVFPKAKDGKKLLYDTGWYKNEDFFKNEKPRTGWRLTSKDVLPDSTSKNYLQQTDLLITHLTTSTYKDRPLPQEYADAFSEYATKKDQIQTLMTGDKWKDASKMLSELKITQLLRETPVEAILRLVLNSYAKDHKPLPSTYTWTSRRASGGNLVLVGSIDYDGAIVYNFDPSYTNGILGVCLSRM